MSPYKLSADEFMGVAPILTNTNGNCMITSNWQATGTTIAVFHLAHLLMKPGFDFLMSLANFAHFVNWPEAFLLNASLPIQNVDGQFILYSDYDGRRLSFSYEQIFALITHLSPQMVIFSKGMWKNDHPACQALPHTMIPFLPMSELSTIERLHGVSLSVDGIDQRKMFRDLPCHVYGEFDMAKILACVAQDVQLIETNMTVNDAIEGKAYVEEGTILIQDDLSAGQYETLVKDCQCPVCLQQFTRAYFHHLYRNTPQLCQRFIAQHNTHFLCQRLKNEPVR